MKWLKEGFWYSWEVREVKEELCEEFSWVRELVFDLKGFDMI